MKIARILELLRSHLAAFALALLHRILSALEKKLLAFLDKVTTLKERIGNKLFAAPSE